MYYFNALLDKINKENKIKKKDKIMKIKMRRNGKYIYK